MSVGARLLRAVGVLAVLGLVVGLLAAFLIQRSSALRWRDRAGEQAELAERQADELSGLENDLEAKDEELAELASQNANFGDRQEALDQILTAAPQFSLSVQDCHEAVEEAEARPDPTTLAEAEAVCSDAEEQAEALEEELNALDE